MVIPYPKELRTEKSIRVTSNTVRRQSMRRKLRESMRMVSGDVESICRAGLRARSKSNIALRCLLIFASYCFLIPERRDGGVV